ncbi:hypothetical protein [Fusobacterium sp.]|uniref:hypothetical protein n=1 Tax=Fusobacterium sp. TaxID=68766 RepID=UPI00396C899D
MRKLFYYLVILACSSVVIYGSEGLGIISDEDFKQVGVSDENIQKAKVMVDKVSVNYKMLLLEKKQLELEVNKYVLEGPEANLDKIDVIFEKIGVIETNILKNRIRSQIQMQKYITQDQYLKAREMAIRRLNSQK